MSHDRRSATPPANKRGCERETWSVVIAAIVSVMEVAFTAAAAGGRHNLESRHCTVTENSVAQTEKAGTARDDIQNLPPHSGPDMGEPRPGREVCLPWRAGGRRTGQLPGPGVQGRLGGGRHRPHLPRRVIDNPRGRYHEMLINASECGPATSRWPGNYRANSWGYLNDFRVGSVLQRKLECVLEKMVAENPHMAGWFADDLGSRSWFPDFDWASFPDKAAYRAGAIALTKTFRKVADGTA